MLQRKGTLIGLIAAAALSPAMILAAAVPRMVSRTLPECEVYDANPKFIHPELVRYLYLVRADSDVVDLDDSRVLSDALANALFSSHLVHGRVLALYERVGAVADGESRLLLKKQVSGPAEVAWRVTGEAGLQHGTCEPLFDGRTVNNPILYGQAQDSRGRIHFPDPHYDAGHYAFALYTPPEDFGADPGEWHTANRGLRLGTRRVTVEIEATLERPADWEGGDKELRSTEKEVLWLVRPPVVLVHGTYDNGRECWEWGKTIVKDSLDVNDEAGLEVKDKHYWRAPPQYQTKNLAEQLRDRGFVVYVVNYEHSNGQQAYAAEVLVPVLERASTSHFRDNAKVVWYGWRQGEPRPGKGIKAALQEFRNNGIAATQADVVGHSMGGVLARVYARGAPLDAPLPVPNDRWYEPPDNNDSWHERPDNFYRGDINRLITIGTTHMGSQMSGFLQQYSYYGEATPPDGVEKTPNPIPAATLRSANILSWARGSGSVIWCLGNTFSGQFPRGAFTDQIPGSEALMAIGATPVPAHAIACVAKPADLELFKGIEGLPLLPEKGLYRHKMELLWNFTEDWFLSEILLRLGQGKDAADVEKITGEIRRLWNQLQSVATEFDLVGQRGIPLSERLRRLSEVSERRNVRELADELSRLTEKGKLRVMAAVFGNDYSDFTVSLSSQLGGLKKPYTTIIPEKYQTATNGVLHSYEPRHKDVQKRVIELLEGGMEPFREQGFPDIKDLPGKGWPPHYAPSNDDAFKPYEHLP